MPDTLIPLMVHHHGLFVGDGWLTRPDFFDDELAYYEFSYKEDPWPAIPLEQRARIESVAERGIEQNYSDPSTTLISQLVNRRDYYRIWLTKPYPTNLDVFLDWESNENGIIQAIRKGKLKNPALALPPPPHPLYLRSEVSHLPDEITPHYRLIHQTEEDKYGHTNRVVGVQFLAHRPVLLSGQDTLAELDQFRHDGQTELLHHSWTIRGSAIQDFAATIRFATFHLLRQPDDDEITSHGLKKEDVEGVPHLRPHYFWGGVPVVPFSTSSSHRLLVGVPGSGKSLQFSVLMRSLLPIPRTTEKPRELIHVFPPPQSPDSPIGPREVALWTRATTDKAVVYDAKTEQVSGLMAAGFEPKPASGKASDTSLFILNPMDERCCGWDAAKDVILPEEIEQFAAAFFPEPQDAGRLDEKDQFFLKNSRALIVAIVHCFLNACYQANQNNEEELDAKWTLLDILKAYETKEDLRKLIQAFHPAPKGVFSQIFDNPDQRTYGNIYSSMKTRMRELEPTALAWHTAIENGKGISLREFVEHGTGTVLVLPETEKNEAVFRPLNEVITRRLCQLLTDNEVNHHSRSNRRTTQVFIDELQSAGRFDELVGLARKGRSYGVEITIGIQSIPDLYTLYGQDKADALLEMFVFRGYLRSQDRTAKWIEEAIGQALVGVQKTSYTCGTSRGHSSSQSHSTTDGSSTNQGFSAGGGSSSGPGGRTNTVSASMNWGWGTSHSVTYAKSHTSTHSTNESKTDSHDERFESAVLASEITGLPDIEFTDTVTGYFVTPHFPVWRSQIPKLQVLKHGLPPGNKKDNFHGRKRRYTPNQNTFLSAEDRNRLSIEKMVSVRLPDADFELPED